jgi:phosphopantothenate---cysteine ligase (ATP)
MYRDTTLEPFSRHFTGQQFLDMLELHENGSTTINVTSDSVDVLAPILSKYKAARHNLLSVPFNSVVDYMWLLRAACECLQPFEKHAMFYSGAAVSDFFVPADKMPTHKVGDGIIFRVKFQTKPLIVFLNSLQMQSNQVPTIELALVPKMIAPLASLWIPRAYVITFKLETDENLLIPKSRVSLQHYKHDVSMISVLLKFNYKILFPFHSFHSWL